MRRTEREAADEILRRAGAMDTAHAAKKRKITSALLVAACLVLVIALAAIMPGIVAKTGADQAVDSSIATLFSGNTAGGYVIVGVIAFALGAGVTLLCIKRNPKDK